MKNTTTDCTMSDVYRATSDLTRLGTEEVLRIVGKNTPMNFHTNDTVHTATTAATRASTDHSTVDMLGVVANALWHE